MRCHGTYSLTHTHTHTEVKPDRVNEIAASRPTFRKSKREKFIYDRVFAGKHTKYRHRMQSHQVLGEKGSK